MTRADVDRVIPVGTQRVRIELAEAEALERVELLSASKTLEHRQTGTTVEFDIPGVDQYEVAALYCR